MNANNFSGPIFIVGASRSGTAMMRSILNQHSLICLAGETHYFDDLRDRMKTVNQTALSKEDEEVCINYFRALRHRPYGMNGNPSNSDITFAELASRAKTIGEGSDAVFEAYCQVYAQRKGKYIWGEKTPRHIYRLRDMMSVYPNARAICMVRDARAVVASYRSWRNQGGLGLEQDPTLSDALDAEEKRTKSSYNIINATLLWRATVNSALVARDSLGEKRVLVQKYEGLIEEPEKSIRNICEWIGIEFEPTMLDIPLHNSSFTKFERHGGISSRPATQWEKNLSSSEIAIIQKIGGKTLKDAGYDLRDVNVSALSLGIQLVNAPFAAVRAALANRDRIGNLPSYIWNRLSMALRHVSFRN